MGVVYRARGADGRLAALKQLLDPGNAARFEIEGRLLAQLQHPRIARVLGTFSEGRDQYLAMDLVEGPDLGMVLREQGSPGLPHADVLRFAREAAEALDYLHAEQVVHRDVKPANLVVGPEGVVLVDFGIARSMDRGDPVTRAIGTPGFMAPEVFSGEGVSARSDVYSLAATIWALLTGAPPRIGDPVEAGAGFSSLGANGEQALRRALDVRPERRVPTAGALVAELGAPVPDEQRGVPLAIGDGRHADALAALMRTAAGVFGAAAASLALIEPAGELVYRAVWGAGAEQMLGVRLAAGEGLAGAVIAGSEGLVVPVCREDPRFAERVATASGYVPHTMILAPVRRQDAVAGVLSLLDRRDGGAYGPADLARAELFADLAGVLLPD
jgi:hypothetical protein